MKLLIEAFKSARKTEIIIVAAALIVLLMLGIGNSIPGDGTVTEMESRMQRILSQIEGAGRVKVMLSEDDSGSLTGAVIAASGAEEIAVRLRLQQAVRTLTELKLDQIEVVKSKR